MEDKEQEKNKQIQHEIIEKIEKELLEDPTKNPSSEIDEMITVKGGYPKNIAHVANVYAELFRQIVDEDLDFPNIKRDWLKARLGDYGGDESKDERAEKASLELQAIVAQKYNIEPAILSRFNKDYKDFIDSIE